MSYYCNKCEENKESEWCDDCEIMCQHICKFENGRQSLSYGENGWTKRIEYSFCDQCGNIEITN